MFEVYGKENDVPPNLLGEISNFLSSNSDVTVLDENDKKELLMSVPKRFRLRIAMSFHQSAANVIDFIKLQDKSFVANIVPQMSYRKYKADTFVYSKGDIADEIYFMFEGKVNYTIGKKLVCFKSMVTGSYFGEIEVIDQVLRAFSVVAETDCQMLIMNKKLLDVVIRDYYHVYYRLKQLATERDRLNKRAMSDVTEIVHRVDHRKQTLRTAGFEFQQKKKSKESKELRQMYKQLPNSELSSSFGNRSSMAMDLDVPMSSSNAELKSIATSVANLTKTVSHLQLCVNDRLCQLEEQVSEMSENLAQRSTIDVSKNANSLEAYSRVDFLPVDSQPSLGPPSPNDSWQIPTREAFHPSH